MLKQVSLAAVAAFLIAADAPGDPAVAFGKRESVEGIRLSPDGSKLAYIAPTRGQGSSLYSVDLASGESKLVTAVDGEKQRLSGCNFVAGDRFVCTVWAMVSNGDLVLPVSRVIAIDEGGSGVKVLSQEQNLYSRYWNLWGGGVIDWLPDDDGAVLMGRDYVPEQRERTRIEQRERGFGVDRIDTRTLQSRRVEAPRLNASEYISDGEGRVRIMAMSPAAGASGMIGETVNYLYRTADSKEWQPFSSYNRVTMQGMNPYAVDSKLNAAYVMERTNGRQMLYRVSLNGSMKKELAASHPSVDVDDVVRIGKKGRVVGATFVTDTRQVVYFDPEIAALAASLSKALPGLPLISVIDATKDESKLLIVASSDVDPGRYYLYDKGTRKLEELMLARPELEGMKLAEVKPFTYPAADGTQVPGYLTLPPGSSGKNLPAIVLPHGGPSARDEWGFDWLAQYFAARGYAVLQPNFRGSAGYGDAWFQTNGFQSWKIAIGDVNDAGRWLVAQGIANPEKLAIFGWSYGGYAALQSNVVAPDLFKAVVAVAPVTDLNLLKEQSRRFTNFSLVKDFIGSGDHVTAGSPARQAARIKAPVLMFHGDYDLNVDVLQSRAMESSLKDAGKSVQFVLYPKLDHYLEDSDVRTDMLRKSDAFLREALKL
jgi:acetyl esterase/lipase